MNIKKERRVSYNHLSDRPEFQSEVIAAARLDGSFDGRAHLDANPIGRAMKAGLPRLRQHISSKDNNSL